MNDRELDNLTREEFRRSQAAPRRSGGFGRALRVLLTLLIVLAVLVAFSRMYLGVHTPLDVGVSLVIATVLVLALFTGISSAVLVVAAGAVGVLTLFIPALNQAKGNEQDPKEGK